MKNQLALLLILSFVAVHSIPVLKDEERTNIGSGFVKDDVPVEDYDVPKDGEDVTEEQESNADEERNEDDNDKDKIAPKDKKGKEHVADNYDEEVDKETNLYDINEKAAEKAGGIIKIANSGGDYVFQNDIVFGKCEFEEVYGESPMEPNPECATVLTKAKARIAKNSKLHQRDITTRPNSKWTLPMPYTVDIRSERFDRTFQSAKDEFTAKTCITFRERLATDLHYLRFTRGGGGCNTHVGYRSTNTNHDVNLAANCEHGPTIAHEIMHTLGFWHEQSRTDRGRYVTINLANVKEIEINGRMVNMSHNFDISWASNAAGFDYDYYSLMHYKRDAFGIRDRNGVKQETITPTRPNIGATGACRGCFFTRIDALQINHRYCNAPKTDIVKDELTDVIKRWAAIYEGEEHETFTRILKTHLNTVYPQYFLIVSSNAVLLDPQEERVDGDCVAETHRGRTTAVCYTRKDQGLTNTMQNSATRAINRALKSHTACDFDQIAESVRQPVRGIQGIQVTGTYVLTSRAGTVRRDARSTRLIYHCNATRKWGIVLVVFGA